MKDKILDIIFIILMIVIVFNQCSNKTTTVEPMSEERIVNILQDNFDSLKFVQQRELDSNRIVINTIITNLEILKAMSINQNNTLSQDQKDLLLKVIATNNRLDENGKDLNSFVDLITSTNIGRLDTVYVTNEQDEQVVRPTLFDSLAFNLHINKSDDWNTINITYDLANDSLVESNVIVKNEFDIAQYKDEDTGASMVEVINYNPYTVTKEGTSSFILDMPEPRQGFTVGLQTGIYMNTAGDISPAVGLGLNYPIDRPFHLLKNIFKKKKNKGGG